MSYVYILRSEKNGRYYIGSASDYKIRIAQYNSGNVAFTKNIRPLKLAYKQEYPNNAIARRIELKLKKFKSRKILDKIVEDQEIRLGL